MLYRADFERPPMTLRGHSEGLNSAPRRLRRRRLSPIGSELGHLPSLVREASADPGGSQPTTYDLGLGRGSAPASEQGSSWVARPTPCGVSATLKNHLDALSRCHVETRS